MGRSGHITSFAIDVTTLEPYKSCGQLANKAQGSALGSLVPNQNVCHLLIKIDYHNIEIRIASLLAS